MWVYHRKITLENEGLKIVKPCEEKLYLPDLPSDWREQVEVVARRQAKVRVDTGIQDDSLDPFDDLTSPYRKIPLDEMHKHIIDELAQSGFTTVWLPDHHLCQTHTVALKQLMETDQYEGVFDTISKGNNPGAPNCYWFPEANGVLHVYRFSPGVAEAETWQQDNEGWTNCRFNWPPDLTKSVTVTDTEEGSLATDATTDLTTDAKTDAKKEEPFIKLISCNELASNSYEMEYLIKDILVARQPCVLGGPKKVLKTSLLVDLAFSLATTTPFLGRFSVKRLCKVLMFSGESGMATLQETAFRVCASKGVQLNAVENLSFSEFLPRFNNRKHLNELEAVIKQEKSEVVIIDPAYLCMPGADANNVQAQGTLLRAINEVCHRNGAGLIIAHHTKKTAQRQKNHQPSELDDLAWSGFPEFARQWLLLSRREDYVPGTGEHELWMSIGGSAGHSSLWAVDVSEGVSGMPRRWEVMLSSPSEVRTEKKATTARQRILAAMDQFPKGECKSTILRTAGIRSSAEAQQHLDSLVKDGTLVVCKVKKRNAATYEGYMLATAV